MRRPPCSVDQLGNRQDLELLAGRDGNNDVGAGVSAFGSHIRANGSRREVCRCDQDKSGNNTETVRYVLRGPSASLLVADKNSRGGARADQRHIDRSGIGGGRSGSNTDEHVAGSCLGDNLVGVVPVDLSPTENVLVSFTKSKTPSIANSPDVAFATSAVATPKMNPTLAPAPDETAYGAVRVMTLPS